LFVYSFQYNNFSLKITNSTPNDLFRVRNDGFVLVGESTINSYLWTQGLGGTFGFSNENGFPYLYLNSAFSNKFYLSNGGGGGNAFAQINTSNGNWLIGNPSTNVYGAVLSDTKLLLQGVDATSSNFGLKVENSASTTLFSVRNDGLFIFNGIIDGATSGNNNFEYKTITGSTRSAYYGATGLETIFDFYTNAVKNTIISEVSGFYKISSKNRFSLESLTTGNIHLWMEGSNGYIGIGNGYFVPTAQTHIRGIDATSSNFALKVENSTPTSLFSIRNDGVVDIYGTITPRLQSIVSSATVTPTNLNDEVVITAQAVALTLANPTGTPVQGQSMMIRIKDNGVARTIGYDTQYRAIGVTLPTTTVANKIVYLGLIYNSTDTKWDVIGVSQEA